MKTHLFKTKYCIPVLSFVLLLLFFIPIFFSHAQVAGNDCASGQLCNYLKKEYRKVPCLITRILQVVVQIGSLVLVVFIVITGLLFATAKGNEGKLTQAKDALLWTIVGAMIVLGAFVISKAVEGTVQQLTGESGGTVGCP